MNILKSIGLTLLAFTILLLSSCDDDGKELDLITCDQSNGFTQQDFYVNLPFSQEFKDRNYPHSDCDTDDKLMTQSAYIASGGYKDDRHYTVIKANTEFYDDGRRFNITLEKAFWDDEVDLTDKNWVGKQLFRGKTVFYHKYIYNKERDFYKENSNLYELVRSDGFPTAIDIEYKDSQGRFGRTSFDIQEGDANFSVTTLEEVDFKPKDTSFGEFNLVANGRFSCSIIYPFLLGWGGERVLKDIPFRIPLNVQIQ